MKGERGVYKYSSTLSLALALDGGGWSKPSPRHFTPTESGLVPTEQEAVWASHLIEYHYIKLQLNEYKKCCHVK